MLHIGPLKLTVIEIWGRNKLSFLPNLLLTSYSTDSSFDFPTTATHVSLFYHSHQVSKPFQISCSRRWRNVLKTWWPNCGQRVQFCKEWVSVHSEWDGVRACDMFGEKENCLMFWIAPSFISCHLFTVSCLKDHLRTIHFHMDVVIFRVHTTKHFIRPYSGMWSDNYLSIYALCYLYAKFVP